MKLAPAVPSAGLRRCLAATALPLLLWPAAGDRAAALLRGAGSGGPPHPEGATWLQPAGLLVVQLERVEPRLVEGHLSHTKDSFYVGNVSVGHPPQEMRVLFDTASGHVLLPHQSCKSPACFEHRRYSPWESSTAADVNSDGGAVQRGARLVEGPGNRTGVKVAFTQADLGSGEAHGILVRDDVCLTPSSDRRASPVCARVAVLAAFRLDDRPFRAMPHDGIVGLALEGLATGALSSFYERLMDGSDGLLPHFGLSLGPEGGKVVFGGHDHTGLAGPLRWFPVARPEEGFWQVWIRTVRVGNNTVDPCLGGCRGIIDSGSSSLGMQEEELRRFLPSLRTIAQPAGGGCKGPNIQFDLGGGFALTLEAEDYTGTSCEPEIGLLSPNSKEFAGVYALGTTVLHGYYAAFDWAQARVGFAHAAGSSRKASGGQASASSPTPVLL